MFYINHIGFFSVQVNVCAQKSLNLICPGSAQTHAEQY